LGEEPEGRGWEIPAGYIAPFPKVVKTHSYLNEIQDAPVENQE